MLSLHTNGATLAAQNSIGRTNSSLSKSMTRLGTGFRVNSAMDDAAGLQIATRLRAQTSGMQTAMRNTQNSISMIQTADGALDETTSILIRMKDLATQAADGSATDTDRSAMQSEYDALTDELTNIVSNTSFGGTTLLSSRSDSKFQVAINFQIGSAKTEVMTQDLSTQLTTMHTDLLATNSGHVFSADGTVGTGTGTAITTAAAANDAITLLDTGIQSVSSVRSSLGAAANRLDHVYQNLSNMVTNTKNASGRIMDVDFAEESASMMSNQMLLQAGTAMLKQSNSQSSLVLSLLQ
ncbi:MAG: Lateral flagellin [Burkholderiaceae bacterium]|nr:Lateral flagellin [Burkholderiaceae bacterium]